MAATNINRVVLTGNLTRDPELRSIPSSGNSVCSLRVACNTRRKDASGDWVDKPNYFDVTVWGAPGRELRAVPLEGPPGRRRRPAGVARVAGQGGQQAPVGRHHRRLACSSSAPARTGEGNGSRFTPQSDVPADTADFQSAPAGGGSADDDIPF